MDEDLYFTKAGQGGGEAESREALDRFLCDFEAFKAANDERLAQIETRLAADAVSTEKMERINRALDEQKSAIDRMTLSLRRPPLARAAAETPDDASRRAAWDAYIRKGADDELRALETKALSGQSDPDGGYLAPAETERMVDRILSEASPLRAISSVRQIGGTAFRKPVTVTAASSGWVGEEEARVTTEAPGLSLLEFPVMELFAMPAATQSLLDDAYVNVDEWLAEEIRTVFAEQEGAAFVNGDGVARPRGFLSYPKAANGSENWGELGFVLSGADGGFAAVDPSDRLIDLVYGVKQAHRAAAHWVMNRSVQAEIRKIKDADGNYIWQPGIKDGQPASLLGYPVTEAPDMPDLAASSFSIAFGDFARGYLIVDRVGLRVLRDPYMAKPYVLFYTTKRVGGGVQNFEAIKLMKFSAS